MNYLNRLCFFKYILTSSLTNLQQKRENIKYLLLLFYLSKPLICATSEKMCLYRTCLLKLILSKLTQMIKSMV